MRYLLAVNKRIDSESLEELMDNFIKELGYNQSLPISEASILLNYHNLQTPLHDEGRLLMDELQEEQDLRHSKLQAQEQSS